MEHTTTPSPHEQYVDACTKLERNLNITSSKATKRNLLHDLHMARQIAINAESANTDNFVNLAHRVVRFELARKLQDVTSASAQINGSIVPNWSHTVKQAEWALQEAEEYSLPDTDQIVTENCQTIHAQIERLHESLSQSIQWNLSGQMDTSDRIVRCSKF